MVIIWGSKLYGKTDEVPGLFYVATRFGHLWYLPLIPTGTFLVIGEDKSRWQGLPMPLSSKSLLLGWGRTGSLIASVVAGIAALGSHQRAGFPAQTFVWFVLAVVLFLVLTLVKSLRYASYERAKELAGRVGLTNKGTILLEAYFGHVDPKELPELLKGAVAKDLAEAGDLEAARRVALGPEGGTHAEPQSGPQPGAEEEDR